MLAVRQCNAAWARTLICVLLHMGRDRGGACGAGGKAQGERQRQPVHVMTQPLCMLPASAFQRMMHEFRTGLSIHKTSAAGMVLPT